MPLTKQELHVEDPLSKTGLSRVALTKKGR